VPCSPDGLPEPAVVLGSDGRIKAANDLAVAMFGSPGRLLDRDLGCFLGETTELLEWLASDDGPALMRCRLRGRRENDVPIVIDLSASRLVEGRSREALCLLRQLGEDRLATEAQRYFDIAFEQSPIGMALFNTDGQYIRVNSSLCEMLGRGAEELLGRRDQEFTHPDDRQSDVDAAWRILEGEIDNWQCEKRFTRPDGTVVWAIANLTFLRSPDGHPLSWVGQFQDITRAKSQEERLRKLADRDALTGLFNRRRLEAELEDRVGHGHSGSLLIVDLDGFKQVNDTHGHHAGDRLLVIVASALREAIRDTDVVARIGGDEFALLLPGAGMPDAQALAAQIADLIDGLRLDFDDEVSVSASVGVATFRPEREVTPEELLAEADGAMYRAKSTSMGRRRRVLTRAGPRGSIR
jgi:diguanylate cyclase (GGDEF)-like protein/PAS domain S-box-containing protein